MSLRHSSSISARSVLRLAAVVAPVLLVFALPSAVASTAAQPAARLASSVVKAPGWVYGPNGHVAVNCAYSTAMCTEVYGWKGTFPYYVGHDEPSVLFDSSQPGSGYQMTYQLTLPRDPGNPTNYSTASTTNTYNMELHPTFWFGMAMCDTQSYPQQNLKTCTPDSDKNITSNTFAGLSSHAGTAYMEMQFYPPGDNHQPDAVNPCLVGQSQGDNLWCAAMNIDSLSEDPVHGTELNSTCVGTIGSVEYVNFGIVTTTGASTGPANPVTSTQATYDGNPQVPTFFMNSGDKLQVTFNDIPNSHPGPNGSGLQVVINDLTTHTSGSMVASSKNGFGMVQAAPSPSTSCNEIPYNFHPMYNTASAGGRVIWAAHTYNVAFADEIGHWDYCSAVPQDNSFACDPNGLPGITEGPSSDSEPSDADDLGCFPPSAAGVLPVVRCIGTNGGFDGASYDKDWPTSETASTTVPTPVTFSSPLTGGPTAASDGINYSQVAFESDLPRVEGNDLPGTANNCQRFLTDDNGKPVANAGQDCFLVPLSDDSTAKAPVHANFYPWFNTFAGNSTCSWQIGGIPSNGTTIKAFGQNNQYGKLYPVTYISGSGSAPAGGSLKTIVNDEDFRNNLGSQPCAAAPPYRIYLGYADGIRPGTHTTPGAPWFGSAHTRFVGCPNNHCPSGTGKYDAGAIRIDDMTTKALTVTNASVLIGTKTYKLWPSSLTVPASSGSTPGSLVLTETSGATSTDNFDTSESTKCGVTNPVVPHVTLTINGVTVTLLDTARILTTHGVDPACGKNPKNETIAWTIAS